MRAQMLYLKDKLGWHYRIRIKRSFHFEYRGRWQSVAAVRLDPGQARLVESVRLRKSDPYGKVHKRLCSRQS